MSRTFSSTGIKLVEIVPVDRAHIVEAEFFEQRAAGDHAATIFFSFCKLFIDCIWQALGELFTRTSGSLDKRRMMIARAR